MPTAVVTGATGCIGRNLIDHLQGWRVIALHRPSSDLSRLPDWVETLECDLATVRPPKADCIFHIAANLSDKREDREKQWWDNVFATSNLARYGRMVFCSTDAASPDAPSQYARSKWAAEEIARAAGAVILRPQIVMGRYDWNNYGRVFRHVQGRVRFVLPGRIQFCHAGEVARAHLLAYERGRGTYRLGGELASWLTVYQKIAALTGARPLQRSTPLWLLYAMGPLAGISWQTLDMLHGEGKHDIDPRSIELGYRPQSLDTILGDYWSWLSQPTQNNANGPT